MTEYTSLLEQLQTTKRELASLRKKYSTLESDSTILRDSEQSLKRTLSSIKDSNRGLESQNEELRMENQRLIKRYEDDVGVFKEEVEKKQHSIRELEMAVDGTKFNNQLLKRQIQCAVQAQFVQELQKKDQKISELQAKYDSIRREKDLNQQKADLKIKSMESTLQQLQARHLEQLKQYANKLYQETHRKASTSEESMLKKLRRELDCTRKMLADKEEHIGGLMGQKTELMQVKIQDLERQRKQKEGLLAKLAQYKKQSEERKAQQELEKAKTENRLTRTYETELKTHQMQINNLQSQLHQKQQMITELRTKQKQLQHEVEKIQKEYKTKSTTKIEEMHGQVEELRRQLRSVNEEKMYYRAKYENYMSNTTAASVNSNTNIRNNENYRQQNNQNQQTSINRSTNNSKNINQQHSQNNQRHKNQTHQEQNISNRRQNRNISDDVHESTTNVNRKNIVNEVNVIEERNVKNIRKVYNEDNEEDDDLGIDSRKRRREKYGKEPREKSYQSEPENHDADGRRRRDSPLVRDGSPIQTLKIQKERKKVRQIARKYIDLQKKYDKCKRKLDEANQKVLELIRNKIAMVSPQKTVCHGIVTNSHGKIDPEAYQSQKNRFGSDKMNSTNQFYRSASPKNNNFYEKSLSYKSKSKTKDLKCMNHDHSEQGCDHSH